jgi:DNA-binding GntR family transcriptional regulator
MSEALPPVRATVASQRIADQIRERILAGELAPGTRIIQDELAEELETSRIPVREALRMLESSGLVTMKSNLGAWVSKMDQRECDLTYRIRERIEPLLLAESLPHLTDADVDELDAIQDQIDATTDVEEFLVLDRRLHWTTYRRHDADELATIVARMWDTTQHYRRAYTHLAGVERRWIISAEHRLLIEAVRDRDVATAQDVLTMHIRRTRIELAAHPEVFEPAPDPAS